MWERHGELSVKTTETNVQTPTRAANRNGRKLMWERHGKLSVETAETNGGILVLMR